MNGFRVISLRTKFILFLTTALLLFGGVSLEIAYQIYLENSVEQHKRLGTGTAKLVADCLDPEKMTEYLRRGEAAPGYLDTKARLYSVLANSPNTQYIYVYRIMEDGCHVIFDLDTDKDSGSSPGEVIPFDKSFAPYVPKLLDGEKIEPVISDDTYGFLLTVYQPVYDVNGKCVCYAAADISMNDLRAEAKAYRWRMLLWVMFWLAVILLLGVFLAERYMIRPLNTMARSAENLAYSSESAMQQGLNGIRNLSIRTGDEIENLYRSFLKMSEESVRYLTDIKAKNDTISRMQRALIFTMADMVEHRDQNTGEHIKKTAAYVKIIMEEMKKEGIYAGELTPEFMEQVELSAPLHDVGKIEVPDAILNKPGKLTEEEFAIMKTHTTAGGKILASLIDAVPGSDYLCEAVNLATYHHERWDGKGYPVGIAGENIPLSARVMAVADVFDALVSNRSYKKGFPYPKALGIIREESGTHFDPEVVKAFFAAEKEVLAVADKFSEEDSGSQ